MTVSILDTDPAAEAAPRLRARPLVLIAEDDEDTRLLFRMALSARGYAVVEAADGETAASLAESARPDLILMDGSLPRLDGVGATRRIRRLGPAGRVPIVFVTGHAEPAFRAEAREAGCDDLIVKPFGFDQLARVLDRHLGGGRSPARGEKTEREFAAMSETTAKGKLLFGLFELDNSGTVIYARAEPDGGAVPARPDVAGCDFYEQMTPFGNVEEFRSRVTQFRQGASPADSFRFNCILDGEPLCVRVLLARIRERDGNSRTKTVLVHIRSEKAA